MNAKLKAWFGMIPHCSVCSTCSRYMRYSYFSRYEMIWNNRYEIWVSVDTHISETYPEPNF